MKQPLSAGSLALALASILLLAGAAAAQSPEVEAFTGISVINLDQPVSPSNFPMLQAGVAAAPRDLVVECFVTARQYGALVTDANSSVGATLSGQVVDLQGATILGNLTEKSNAIGPAGVGRFSWGTFSLADSFDDDEALSVGVAVSGNLTGSVSGGIDQVTLKCRGLSREKCSRSNTNACFLPSQRFQAYVLNQNGSRATVKSNAAGSSTATFNVSGGTATASLVNNCVPGGNNHFWVSLSSTTSASFTLVVEDTGSGEVVSYPNITTTDKAAFPTCPP